MIDPVSVGNTGGVDVSIVIAVKNGFETIEQCLASAVSQLDCSVQIIVIDGMSGDGTEKIIRSFGPRIDVVIREADEGISDAWNKGIARARGTWCLFLGADDFFVSERALAGLLACCGSDRGLGLVFGGVKWHGSHEELVHPDPADLRRFLVNGNMIPHQAVLHRTTVLREVGGFDNSLRIRADADALMRILAVSEYRRCDAVPVVMRRGGISDDPAHRKVAHQERLTVLRRHNSRPAALVKEYRLRTRERTSRSTERVLRALLGETGGKAHRFLRALVRR